LNNVNGKFDLSIRIKILAEFRARIVVQTEAEWKFTLLRILILIMKIKHGIIYLRRPAYWQTKLVHTYL